MALAVASTSTAQGDSGTIVVTKPSGVAVGDLLLIAGNNVGNVGISCTGFTAGATSFTNNPGAVPDAGNAIIYRVATSTDVAASNYSVTVTDGYGVVVMLRVTGWNVGNPIYATDNVGSYQDATSYTLTKSGLSLRRPSGDSLVLILSTFLSTNSPYSSATSSGYSITSGVSNPTWTEVIDVQQVNGGGLDRLCFALAYAITTSNTDITAFSVTGATDTSGTEDGEDAMLVVINGPQNQTGTNALFQTTPTFFSNAGVIVGGVGTNALHQPSPNFPTQSGRGTAPTNWTNPDKTSTTWTNPDK